jgi:hypothetical protein
MSDSTSGVAGPPEPTDPADEAIKELRRWVNYNSTDMGELGTYVRLDYVLNGIGEFADRLAAARAVPARICADCDESAADRKGCVLCGRPQAVPATPTEPDRIEQILEAIESMPHRWKPFQVADQIRRNLDSRPVGAVPSEPGDQP